jgi:hypothetical protein
LVRENQHSLAVKKVITNTVKDQKHIADREDHNIYKHDNSNTIQKAQSRRNQQGEILVRS